MSSPSKKLKRTQGSVHLDVPEQQQPEGSTDLTAYWGSCRIFVPGGGEIFDLTPTPNRGPSMTPAPEKQLTLFALQLAVIEKAASGLGTLGFVWATVVLLGGFAVTLEVKDFWMVTAILVAEGTRVFGRSHELEWQHQATKTPAGRYSFRGLVSSSRSLLRAIKNSLLRIPPNQQVDTQQVRRTLVYRDVKNPNRRTWRSSDVPLLPYVGWFFVAKNISKILAWLQLASALTCIALSSMRLIQQDYASVSKETVSKETRNRKASLDIFYGLALAEATAFLLEKAYWQWKIEHGKLLERVSHDCGLGDDGLLPVRRFFYDAFSSCVNGSIFDCLKMDLISFSGELLDSDSADEQTIGARILQRLVMNKRFSEDTLRKVGTSADVIERLVEMLNWKNPAEQEIRRCAAQIVSKLAGKKQNALRLAGISGSIESISSLLYCGRGGEPKPHEIHPVAVVADRMDYEFSVFNLLGLLILKKLSRDHDNCGKIGNARGLLAKIIDFTQSSENLLRNDLALDSQIKAVRRSLQLVKMLVSATGHTGKALRRDISDIVFTVSNIRDILRYGERHMVLQKLGIEILTSLAMDEEAREKIGSTGGVIKLLLRIFFEPGMTDEQNSVRVEAGEALAMLALDTTANCRRILNEGGAVDRLLGTLVEPKFLRVNSTRILKNLCASAAQESMDNLRGVTAAIPIVLNRIMVKKDKLQEVSLGLIVQIFSFTSLFEEYEEELNRAGINDTDFANNLVEILKKYSNPDIKVPRIRLFVIEIAIQMMKSQWKYIQLFKDLAMEEVLECVAETTSELEAFNVFSGSVGLSRHKTTISSLVETALKLMTNS